MKDISVETNQDIESLKEEALDLGIEFSPNIGYDKLKARVDERLEEIAQKQRDKKEAKQAKTTEEKVKIIVEPRDGSDNIQDQFFGFNGQSILVRFGEEVEVTKSMYKFIKGIGAKVKKFKIKPDSDGIPQKQWYDKWESRFFVELVD